MVIKGLSTNVSAQEKECIVKMYVTQQHRIFETNGWRNLYNVPKVTMGWTTKSIFKYACTVQYFIPENQGSN